MDDLRISDIGSEGFGRRGFLKGVVGVGLASGLATIGGGFFFDPGMAYADGPTVGLPTTGTAPEQVHLTWGEKPAHQVTVSWTTPGTAPQPHPTLAYSIEPIGPTNPGRLATVQALAFTDGLNLEKVHWYHAELTGLEADQRYFYTISDGATPAATFSSNFLTAPPVGRATFAFTSYGDLATPTAHLNDSGQTWAESSDNSYYAVSAVEAANPLFHLLNGDLCYANLNSNNQPEVWADFGRNIERSAAQRPWMPCLGNHEIEFGVTGRGGTGVGHFNGAHGYGSYLTRFALPRNGIKDLRGNFYKFQVGTVLFISLDADDVIYQDGGAFYAPPGSAPLTATNPAVSIAPGTSNYNNQYTGALSSGPDNTLIPDPSSPRPNQQTRWLEGTLKAARADGSIDMIIVFMHQVALSSTSKGNGSDLGIRQAWLPLFDTYSVDLVLSGHEHNYERSFAVRGYDPGLHGTVAVPNPGQTLGAAVDTRRPTVVSNAQTTYQGLPGFDTGLGTVFLVLGGGGTDGPTNGYGVDPADGARQAKVITTRNLIHNPGTGWVRDGADSIEDATWSAQIDTDDSYGYALFEVDPGDRPGDTVITMTYFHAPQAGGNPSSGNAGYVGSTSYTPYEKVAFGRGLASGPPPALPEFATPALALGAAAVVGGTALYLAKRKGPTMTGSTAG